MSQTPARELADAFYSLEKLRFFRPHEKFPTERALVQKLIAKAQSLGPVDFPSYARDLVRTIATYCQDQALPQSVLYRAFDGLDEVLEINYLETQQTEPANDRGERLYERGGIGVQTSYSSIVKVLEHLQLPLNSHLVDLGSGFGRVGLAAGLWREDLRFSGYEFVGNRVAAANFSAERAGVSGRVRFMQQDLGDPAFKIPAADAYYLYDPFSDSTYQHVFAHLAAIADEREIAIIAKAGAKASFQRWMKEENWPAPEAVDEGTIYIYRKPAPKPVDCKDG